MNPIILTAALNGPIASLKDHPGLPVTPELVANAAVGAREAGATVAHIHIRDQNALPTGNLEIAKRTVEAIREKSDILIQLSTGVGLGASWEERAQLVELKPRMATLNPCSMTFGTGEFHNPPAKVRQLAARMQELDVKPELEVYDSGHIDVCLDLFKEGLLNEPLQFSIVMGVRGGMAATVDNLLHTIRRMPKNAIWQAIVVGRNNVDLTTIAMLLGGNVRTGLEDTLHLTKGVLAPDNAALVSRAANICTALGRRLATLEETQSILGLKPVA